MKNTRINNKQNQSGFTIVELMIATIIFSMALLLITFGLLQVTRTYYKGVTSDKTQQTARAIMDEISQAIQFSGGPIIATPTTAPGAGVSANFCINGVRYSYVLDRQLTDGTPNATQTNHVLLSDAYSACSSSTALNLGTTINLATLSNPRELIGPNMRLAKMNVMDKGNGLWQIDVMVVYGDTDLLAPDHKQCASLRAGTQFCAVAALSTIVQKRLN
jgi:prepilin-type N-terminal cleavage/methylation domain-containing protein